MSTIPEPFVLRNAPVRAGSRRGGFRVPFGVRDGRAWAPSEVEPGKRCGCSCPGCGQPLVAKALGSRRKRPHFAHLVASECSTGRETGIHLRAKQVIAERAQLLLPAWEGDLIDMPNPLRLRDEAGEWHEGMRVDFPAVIVGLRDVVTERRIDGYQPDLTARDDVGELLIEVRVTHAVDDSKAEWVRAQGRRMIEIDLSQMDRDTPHDPAAFEHEVLFEVLNRSWISCPEAVSAWGAAKSELEGRIAVRNSELARERAMAEASLRSRTASGSRQQRDRAAAREFMRTRERTRHAADLEKLPRLATRERVCRLLEEYRKEAQPRIIELQDTIPAAALEICLIAHPGAWIYGVAPELWQLLAFKQFVSAAKEGARFNQRDMASWVIRSFPREQTLYRLFAAKYRKLKEAQRAGFNKRRLDHWAFTTEENAAIPNFYAPVNDFIERLAVAGWIRRLRQPIGECEAVGLRLDH